MELWTAVVTRHRAPPSIHGNSRPRSTRSFLACIHNEPLAAYHDLMIFLPHIRDSLALDGASTTYALHLTFERSLILKDQPPLR